MRLASLLLMFLLIFSSYAEGQKRYKQRNLKLQASADFDLFDNDRNHGFIHLNGSKNWGYFELGVLLNLDQLQLSEIGDTDLQFGVLGEVNIIKNMRRNDIIPAVGLKVIASQLLDIGKYSLNVNPYGTLKLFVSSRTSINIDIEYPIQIIDGGGLELGFWKDIQFRLGYAYYFH